MGVEPDHLDVPSAQPLRDAVAPSYRRVFEEVWPAGVGYALGNLHRAASGGEKLARHGQYHLSLCQLWQDVTDPPGAARPGALRTAADARRVRRGGVGRRRRAGAVDPPPVGAEPQRIGARP